MCDRVEIFEKYAEEYDGWFDKHRFAYESEIVALKMCVPKDGKGMEIGVGTGRFAVPLGVKIGVEPAKAMADIARRRGVKVIEAKGEELPFDDNVFDYVLIIVTICFVEDVWQVLKEAKRVVKPSGYVIIGMIDKDSFLGRWYMKRKHKSKFYRYAKFYSTEEVMGWLNELGFKELQVWQTIFELPERMTQVAQVKPGYGEGGFVVIRAVK